MERPAARLDEPGRHRPASPRVVVGKSGGNPRGILPGESCRHLPWVCATLRLAKPRSSVGAVIVSMARAPEQVADVSYAHVEWSGRSGLRLPLMAVLHLCYASPCFLALLE